MRTPRYLVAAVLLAGGLAACGDDKTAPDPCTISGVTLASVPAQMAVGQTATAQATVQQQGCSPVPAVVYSSTDAAVVSVSSAGVVTAVGVGQATITAQIQGRPEKATAAVVVTGRVLSIGVRPDTGTIFVAGSLQLAVDLSVDPGAPTSVSWRSADPTRASVSATGLVTGVAAGTVAITAVADLDTTKRATARVSVLPRVTGVSVLPVQDSLRAGQARILAATVTGDPGVVTTVTWRSADPAVATVASDGTVTAVAAGTTSVTAIATADTTRRAQATIKVLPRVSAVTVTPPTAVIEIGSSVPFSAAVAGDPGVSQSVVWSSSDPTVATVSVAGVVTGVAPGFVTLVATSVADPAWKGAANLAIVPVPQASSVTDFCVDWDGATTSVSGVRAAAAPRAFRSAPARLIGGCPTVLEMELAPGDAVGVGGMHYPDYNDLTTNWTSTASTIIKTAPTGGWQTDLLALAPGTASVLGAATGGRSVRIDVAVKSAPSAVCLALTAGGPCVSGRLTLKVGQTLDLYAVASGASVSVFWGSSFGVVDWIPTIGRRTTVIGQTAGSVAVIAQWGSGEVSTFVQLDVVP